jgi:hypothetical protein
MVPVIEEPSLATLVSDHEVGAVNPDVWLKEIDVPETKPLP